MGVSFLRRSWTLWKSFLGHCKMITNTPPLQISAVAHCWFSPLWNYWGLLKQQPAADHWDCWRAETDEQATKVGSASFSLLLVLWSGLTRIRISQKAELRGQLTADISSPHPPLLHCCPATPGLLCAHPGPRLSNPSSLHGQQRKREALEEPMDPEQGQVMAQGRGKWETRLIDFNSPDKDCKGLIFHFNMLSIRKTVQRGLVFV